MSSITHDFTVKRTPNKVEITSDDSELLDKTKEVIELVHDQLIKLNKPQFNGLVDDMVSLLISDVDTTAFQQASLNAKAKARHLIEWPLQTAEEVHELTGSKSANKSSTATRWRKKRLIFSIKDGGRTLYPAYQFQEDGQPYPVIKAILSIFGESVNGWQIALWLTSPNGWLGGRLPVERFTDDPEAVVAAAKDEVKPGVY